MMTSRRDGANKSFVRNQMPLPPTISVTSEIGSKLPKVSRAIRHAIPSHSGDKELDTARNAVSILSTDHPEWCSKAWRLAAVLRDRYDEVGHSILLNECINLWRQICAQCVEGHPDRASAFANLAIAVRTQFERMGDESLLIEAINLDREALYLRPHGHPDRHYSCGGLAVSLITGFQQKGDHSLLIEAIGLEREALSLRPYGHPLRHVSCSNLAGLLRTYFEQTGSESLVAEAINLNREALSLRPHGHPLRHHSCVNLANSLREQFKQTGDESLLTEAIALDREALSLQPHGHPDRHRSCSNLATSLKARFRQTGNESLLTEATNLHREALSLQPHGHPSRHIACANLADSLRTRFQQTGDESLLTEAIHLDREALSHRPHGHPSRDGSCSSLALSLWTRFEQTGDESLIMEAISLEREALSLRHHGHPGRHDSCGGLALLLRTRFEQTGDASLLTEAINLDREALSLRPLEHPSRHYSCINLAGSLWTRFYRTGETSLVIEAINLERQALSLLPQGHPSRHVACANLALSLETHFQHTGDKSLLTEAVNLHRENLNCLDVHHPSRWRHFTGMVKIFLEPRFPMNDISHAIDYLQHAVMSTPDSLPQFLSVIASLVGRINPTMISHDLHLKLLRCSSAAIDIASIMAGFVLDQASQLRYLKDCQHLGPQAYLCATLCTQPEVGIQLLECARAIVWSQSLHMRDPQLGSAPPKLASELSQLLRSMTIAPVPVRAERADCTLQPLERDVRHENNARIQKLIKEIRSTPGHEDFMRGLPFDALAKCAARNSVVVLVSAEDECHALIIRPNEQAPMAMRLQDITPGDLTAISGIVSAARMRGSVQGYEQNSRLEMKMTSNTHYGRILGRLWAMIVKPVINRIGLQKATGNRRPRLHWCPTGPFTFIPLHAAGIYSTGTQECCSDYVVSSYTPTLTALLRAQKSDPTFRKHDVKPCLISTVKAQDATLPTLWNVEEEINVIRSTAQEANVVIDDDCVLHQAILTRADEALRTSNLAHIACHGTQDAKAPLSSGFCLADGNLTITRLIDLDLKDAFFAFLSACETAKGDQEQPDQTVHLAAAMLFVGFRSVVATMWAMGDADGPLIAKHFYERLFAEEVITLDAIPYALDYAVTELRKIGVPPERWATFIYMGA